MILIVQVFEVKRIINISDALKVEFEKVENDFINLSKKKMKVN